MPRRACRHFERKPRAFHSAFYIGMFNNEWQAQGICRARDQPFVRITAAPAQSVVEMRNGELPLVLFGEPVKQMKQHHRIHAAGNRDQNFLPAAKKAARANVLLNEFQQAAHAGNANASAVAGKVIGAL